MNYVASQLIRGYINCSYKNNTISLAELYITTKAKTKPQ